MTPYSEKFPDKYPPLKNIHTWKIFTPGKYSPLKNIHPWKVFTPAKYSLLKNIHPWKITTSENYSPLKKNIHPWNSWKHVQAPSPNNIFNFSAALSWCPGITGLNPFWSINKPFSQLLMVHCVGRFETAHWKQFENKMAILCAKQHEDWRSKRNYNGDVDDDGCGGCGKEVAQ